VDRDELAGQLLATWRRHQEILLYLVGKIPAAGFAAVPSGSRGRDVARQLQHLARVRTGWVVYHTTGKRPRLPRADRTPRPTRAQLTRALKTSGTAVERFLVAAFRGEARPRMFGRQVVRWMAYLIEHEAHHRGQMLLALKQNGMRLPDKVSMEGIWGRWIFGS
jgi:uncharacterized damage-inducible protein DinB